jgi:hypothetical protein
MSDFSLDKLSTARRAEISANDQRRAAIHEAGHFVIAKHLGLSNVQAEIRKIEPQDYTEKEWVGSTWCLTEGADASTRIMMAVAGAVAEACWDNETFDELDMTLEDFPEQMSQSDWDMSGCTPGEVSEQFWDAMEQVFELLSRDSGKLWNALLAEADGLIERSQRDLEQAMLPEPSSFVR